MHTPDEVQVVAQRIGTILRATGKVKRGIGTIIQDVNVSIKGGPVVEIKGVQDLALLPTIIEYETSRQWNLLEIMGEIKKRKLVLESILDRPIDVSEVFKNTECRVIKNALKTKGKVLAVKLEGFKGVQRMWPSDNSGLASKALDGE